MAEIAKLAIDIDASSATTAAAKMRQFGDTSADAATKAQRGAVEASTKVRVLENALEGVARAFGISGPAANLAADAFFNVGKSFGAISAAGIAAAAGLGALTHSLTSAQTGATKFQQAIESKDIGFFRKEIERMTDLLRDRQNPLKDFANSIHALFGGDTDALVTDLTGKIADYTAELLKIDASKAREVRKEFEAQAQLVGATPLEKIAIGAQQQVRAVNRAFEEGKIGVQEYRASLAGIAEVKTANINEFNRGLREQIELLKSADDPLRQIEIRSRNLGTGPLADELKRLQQEAQKIAIGAPLVARGFSDLGASAVLPKSQLDKLALSAFELERRFQAGLISAKQFTEGLKGIASGGLSSDTQAFLKRIGEVRGDLGQVAGQQGVGASQFESILGRLQGLKEVARDKFGLDIPPEILSKLSEVESKTREIATEKKININADSLTATIEKANETYEILQTLRTPIQIAADNEVSAQIESMLQTYRAAKAEMERPINVTIKTEAEGSPKLGFSEYFGSYAPGVVQDFARNAGRSGGIAFDSGLGDLVNRLKGSIGINVNYLQNDAFNAKTSALHGFAASQVGAAQGTLNFIEDALGLPSSSRLGPRQRGATSIGPNVSAGGGAGSVVMNVYIQNNEFGNDITTVIHNEVVPLLRDELMAATGREPNLTVQN